MVVAIDTVPPLTGVNIEATALADVERRFREQLSPLRLVPGAALAVYHRGQLALDLGSGFADTQRGELVGPDTLFPIFSGTKPFGAVALWQQIERGRLALDDAVANTWPEFGQHGKDRVLVRHLLSHRGGFPTTPPALTPDRWGDADAVLAAVAAMPAESAPGAVSAYHFLTQHWVIAEVIRRLDGRSFDVYVREEITAPLGMTDTYVGLPPEHEHRVARMHATDGADEWGLDGLRRLSRIPLHRLVVPGASGVSTARDMARFYATIAGRGTLNGVAMVQPRTVERMLEVEIDGATDATFNVPIRRGLGFELGGLADPRRHWPGATSTVRTFWHGGFGSSICWGDTDTGLAMAFLSNGLRRDEAGAVARRDLSDAVRAADWGERD